MGKFYFMKESERRGKILYVIMPKKDIGILYPVIRELEQIRFFIDQDLLISHGLEALENIKNLKFDDNDNHPAKETNPKQLLNGPIINIDYRTLIQDTLYKILEENINSGIDILCTIRNRDILNTDKPDRNDIMNPDVKKSFKGYEILDLNAETKDITTCKRDEYIREMVRNTAKRFLGISQATDNRGRTFSAQILKEHDYKDLPDNNIGLEYHDTECSTPMIIVAGFPGSGKSTVSKKIGRLLRIPFIDKDTIGRQCSDRIVEAFGSYPGDHETNAFGALARRSEYEDMGNLAAMNLQLGKMVILTSPFNAQIKSYLSSRNGIQKSKEQDQQNRNNTNHEKCTITSSNQSNVNCRGSELYLYDPLTNVTIDQLPIQFIWVLSTREIDHNRLYKRGADRDSWKLSHWIWQLNDSIRREKELNLTKITGHDCGVRQEECYLLRNEFDDNLNIQLEYLLKFINTDVTKAFPIVSLMSDYKERSNNKHVNKFSNKNVCCIYDDENNDDIYNFDSSMISSAKNKLFFSDIYFTEESLATITDHKTNNAFERNTTIQENENPINKYLEVCKNWRKFYYNNNPTQAVVFDHIDFTNEKYLGILKDITGLLLNEIWKQVEQGRDYTEKKTIEDDTYSEKIKAFRKVPLVSFQRCIFEDEVLFKKNYFALEFDDCKFHQGVTLFNRSDARQISPYDVSFFRCEFDDSLTINEYNAVHINIEDCRLHDVICNNVSVEQFTLFNCTLDKLEFLENNIIDAWHKDDADKRNDCTITIRENRINDFVRFPYVKDLKHIQYADNQISKYYFDESTIHTIEESRIRQFQKIDLNETMNWNVSPKYQSGMAPCLHDLTRRLDFYNQLYETLTAQNKYDAADSCILNVRIL